MLPLAAYLLSWIVAFWRPERAERWGLMLLVPPLPLLLIEAMTPVFSHTRPLLGVGLHVLALLGAGLLAHGRLALRRPEPAALTIFYLHLSLGGALGGTVNALLAPALLDRPLEYPFALAALCPLPAAGRGRGPWMVWGTMAALMAAAPFVLGLRGERWTMRATSTARCAWTRTPNGAAWRMARRCTASSGAIPRAAPSPPATTTARAAPGG